MHRLSTDYAKNYCNRALIVKVIVENVVTCFLLGHSVGYTADGFYRSDDPTNSVKALMEGG